MSYHRAPPPWRLPEGVNLPLWEYLHTPRLAVEEDAYFAGHPLHEQDARIVDAHFETPGRLVDLGCGAGRHALRFAARNFTVVAIDLSRPMLQAVRRKALELGECPLPLLLEANLCRLSCLADGSFDYALSMFSTMGMIRSRAARKKALAEASRLLRPGGRLALHVHSLWLNSRTSQGRLWLLGQFGRALRLKQDVGDRRMTYRGIHGMEVHLYRWGELKRELRGAGFNVDESIPLDDHSYKPIKRPWLFPNLRAGGWIVFAIKP
jgi:SAM-dependent methyltransferase